MRKSQFELAVKSAPLNSVAKTWFPKWISRYASFLRARNDADLPVERENVIGILRMLRDPVNCPVIREAEKYAGITRTLWKCKQTRAQRLVQWRVTSAQGN